MTFLIINFVFLITVAFLDANNPCSLTNVKQIPHSDGRFVNNKMEATDTLLSDRDLEESWYKVGDEKMPVAPPGIFSCGTLFPIWLNDTLPTVGEFSTQKIACIETATDECGTPIKLNITNCGTYYLYYLHPTEITSSAYCFGVGVHAARPTYVPNPVVTRVEIDYTINPVIGQIVARCNFSDDSSQPGVLLYTVDWYFNGIYWDSTETVNFNEISKTDLILNENNIKRMGKYVLCKVRAKTVIMGPPGPEATGSNFFAGIEVKTPVVTMKRGSEGAYIIVKPSVGIGCYHALVGTCECQITIAMSTIEDDQCKGNIGLDNDQIQQSSCSKQICGHEMDQEHKIYIKAREENGHYYSAKHEISLTTDINLFHAIWGLYDLPKVMVEIEEADDTNWSLKYCQAQDDPHFLTFDQRPYDFHSTGTFILYKHSTEQIEVQIRQEACSNDNMPPHCTCGVAVRVGGDIFVLDRCGKKYIKKAKFTSCMDAQLKVHKTSNSKYIMYTPIGSRIEAVLRGNTFMTVQVYPSLRDVYKTRGLCGTLSNKCTDDFMMSNETLYEDFNTIKQCHELGTTDYQFQPDTFSETWRVQDKKNYFDDNYTFDESRWNQRNKMCVCKKRVDEQGNIVIDANGKVQYETDCSSSSVVTCEREIPVAPPDSCQFNEARKKRSQQSLICRRQKRGTHRSPFTEDVNEIKTEGKPMTELEARDYCISFMNASESFRMCKDIPNVNPDIAINTCILDILMTNSTAWAIDAREGIKGKCLGELLVNSTLNNENESDGISIAQRIRNRTCINECLGKGICENGKCICQAGFGGGDCGIDLSIPPIVERIIDDGICDVDMLLCENANLEGDGFTSEGNSTCRIRTIGITINGSKTFGTEQEITKGNPSTIMTMYCPLNITKRLKRSTADIPFVTGYSISVSNDGIHFGEEFEMYRYNSSYQVTATENGEIIFHLKSEFCLISNIPYRNGTPNPMDPCQKCSADVKQFEWSENVTPECQSVPQKQSTGKEINVAIIVGVVTGSTVVIIVLLVLFIMWKFFAKRTKRFNSKVCVKGIETIPEK